MIAKVYITLKESILDPQGKTIMHSLESLDFEGIENVRLGKMVEIQLNTNDKEKAATLVENMCKKLLVNSVMEAYTFEILD